MNEVIEAIIALLRANSTINDRFKVIDFGPVNISAKSNLPAIYISPITTNIIGNRTKSDQVIYGIKLTVAMDLRSKFGDTSSPVPAHKQLTEWIEERNGAGTGYASDTIMNVLRANISASNTLIYSDNISIEYPEPIEGDNYRILTAEITIETAEASLLRP